MDSNGEKTKYKRIIAWAVVGVVIAWGLTFLLFLANENIRGPFGDMFGAINALFSGLAFGGIILTIYMQRDELALQRQELQETREVFEDQSKIMANQQNDATFFNLLQNHRELIASFNVSKRDFHRGYKKQRIFIESTKTGYELIEEYADKWKDYLTVYSEMYRNAIIHNIDHDVLHPSKLVVESDKVKTMVDEISHIMTFVDSRFVDKEKKQFYFDSLRNSILDSEKFLVYIYSILFKDQVDSVLLSKVINEEYSFIDFSSQHLPEFRLNIDYNKNDNYEVKITTDGLIKSWSLIVTDKYSETDFSINSVNNLSELVIGVADLFIQTKYEVENEYVPNEWVNGSSFRKYYLCLKIEHLQKEFNVIQEIQVESRGGSGNKLALDEIPHQRLTAEKSKELIDLLC